MVSPVTVMDEVLGCLSDVSLPDGSGAPAGGRGAGCDVER